MSNPLIAAITPKWAKNISESFGRIAESLAAAGAAAAKRVRVLSNDTIDGFWAVNFGVSLARNGNVNAAWRYELYLSFWTKTVRIGFVPYKPILLKDVLPQSVGQGAPPPLSVVEEEYYPDEANERP